MTPEDINRQVRAFLSRHLANPDITDDDDIFVTGGASSLFAMELVMFIEETFQIELEDEDLERDNLASIGKITLLVSDKLGIVAEAGEA